MSKNGSAGLHSLCTISPQSRELNKNEDLVKRNRVGVTGIGPVKLL